MADTIDLVVVGDPARAKATAAAALGARTFRLTWTDEWSATAERGNKVANVFLGALAQYFKVGVRVMAAPTPGQSVVRLEKQSSGWAGGAIGANRTKKNLVTLRDELAGAFQQAGVLVGVQET
jgi:hypothetical protein